MSKSVQRRRALQRGETLAAGGEVPAIPRHERVDLALRQHAQRLELAYLDFCVLAEECIREKFYERFGYVDAEPYFQERVGISYRTLRRRLSILEGLNRLPEQERSEAKATLAKLGAHKASALAPILGRPGEDWREWTAFAAKAREEAVQAAVSDLTEARPRGRAPEDRFLTFILNQVPIEEREHVRRVFDGIMRLTDPLSPMAPMAAFLVLVNLGHQELVAHGKWKDE